METVLESRSERVVIGAGRPFCIVGERINPTGRKSLAEQMAAGDFSVVESDAVEQVEAGAHVLDVNAGVPLADEPALMAETVQRVQALVDVPLCLDSSVVAALEAGLAVCEGKPLVNSVTSETTRLEQVLPLIAKHGAAVIGLVSGDAGIPATPEDRLAEARKIIAAAAEHGIPIEDIVFDPLAMGAATDPKAPGITLETIRLFTTELGANTILGASNVSFGLPLRPWINASFLAMAIGAGLTAAIMNPLSTEARTAVRATDLLLGKDEYGMAWIAASRATQPATTH